MKVQANSINELINNSPNPKLMIKLKEIIESKWDEKPVFVNTNSVNMIGYAFIHYKNSTFREDLWPLVAIAPQKNFVGLYLFIAKNDRYFLEDYSSSFKKSECGKSCLRVSKLDEDNIDIITEIISDAISYIKNNIDYVKTI